MKKVPTYSISFFIFIGLMAINASATYDPTAGKWLSPDPLQEGGGPNFYAFCNGDPVNNVDPDGLEAYVVYRQFDDPDLKKWYPDQGHFFLAFDEKELADIRKWRNLVKRIGPYTPENSISAFAIGSGKEEEKPDPNLETFSFHPWEVYSESEGKAYNIAGTVLSLSSYIGYGDKTDREAFENARDNRKNPDPLKALLFPLHVTDQQQFDLYEKAIASRNINNKAPQSWDMGPYMLGMQNCGTWTHWITKQAHIEFPSEARRYNLMPLVSRVPVFGRMVGGVGIGGVADYTLVPQATTLVLGTGGAVLRGAGYAGYGIYRAGATAIGFGGTVIDRAELFPGQTGVIVQWRF